MIDTQVENMVDDFARRIQSQGLSMEQYMQFTGATVDSLKEQMNRRLLRESRADWYLRKLQKQKTSRSAMRSWTKSWLKWLKCTKWSWINSKSSLANMRKSR
nr:hypothetical protein [Blautia sp. TF12-12AT]